MQAEAMGDASGLRTAAAAISTAPDFARRSLPSFALQAVRGAIPLLFRGRSSYVTTPPPSAGRARRHPAALPRPFLLRDHLPRVRAPLGGERGGDRFLRTGGAGGGVQVPRREHGAAGLGLTVQNRGRADFVALGGL